ncbi:MAG: hypothetical protein C4B58_14610 [Deltaproteobacteria bacterium]|nr:MAG: hypothetical protein C4B58_14610 [Deltaproteobacteria bacterium]
MDTCMPETQVTAASKGSLLLPMAVSSHLLQLEAMALSTSDPQGLRGYYPGLGVTYRYISLFCMKAETP